MDFLVRRFVRWDGRGSLKAFCDISVDERLLIKGIRVVEGRQGPFVTMPRQQTKDRTWSDVVVPMTRDTKLALSRIILEAFYQRGGPIHEP